MLDPEKGTVVRWDDIGEFVKVPLPAGYVHPWARHEPYETHVYDDLIGVQHLSFVISRMPPGSSGQHHRHVEAEEIHCLMRGRCEMMVGRERITMRPLDVVRVPAHEYRSMFNPGPDEAWMLVAGAPLEEFLESTLDQFFAVNDWSDGPH